MALRVAVPAVGKEKAGMRETRQLLGEVMFQEIIEIVQRYIAVLEDNDFIEELLIAKVMFQVLDIDRRRSQFPVGLREIRETSHPCDECKAARHRKGGQAYGVQSLLERRPLVGSGRRTCGIH